MKAYEIHYNLPGSSGNRETVLALDENKALENLEKKDTSFKNIGGYYKVNRIIERSLDEVKVGKLSVLELLALIQMSKGGN
jgi:hypothetical protein